MPARRKGQRQTEQKGGETKAFFCFALRDPKMLSAPEGYRIIKGAVDLHAGDAQRRFKRVLVLAEGADREPPIPEGRSIYRLPVRVLRVERHTVESVLAAKYRSESQAVRQQGHVSIHAPEVLEPDTLVIVIGSQGFLGRAATHFLDRNQSRTLLEKLNDVLLALLDLKEIDEAQIDEHSYYECPVENGDFYADNFNRLVEEIERLRRAAERARGEAVARRLGFHEPRHP